MCQSINLIKGDLKVFNFLHYRYVSICNLIKNEKFLQLKIFKYQKMFQNDFEAQNRKSLKRETMELKIVKNISYSSWSDTACIGTVVLGNLTQHSINRKHRKHEGAPVILYFCTFFPITFSNWACVVTKMNFLWLFKSHNIETPDERNLGVRITAFKEKAKNMFIIIFVNFFFRV